MNVTLNHFWKNKKGVSSIEFTLTIGVFLFVVFLILELARIVLLSAYWDLAIAEGVRITKNQKAVNGNYEELFKKNLIEQRNKYENYTLAYLAESSDSKIEVKVEYADTLNDLINGNFRQPTKDKNGNLISPTGKEASIASYTVNYNYKFLLPLPMLAENWVNTLFQRKILIVQEYERTEYKY
ncbi:TadE/TadG family type IV pilus assembly protein [Volucribacter psittacicida]|nr:TadE family protein [Volucribacter psittacicida]